MIVYDNRSVMKVFKLAGSVFPHSLAIALPCAVLASVVKVCGQQECLARLGAAGSFGGSDSYDSTFWTGFSTTVVFFLIFRTSHAYNRFWDGAFYVRMMSCSWYNACSLLFAFSKFSDGDGQEIWRFKHMIVRLFAALHGLALADIECKVPSENIRNAEFEFIDLDGLDKESIQALENSRARVLLVSQWIQQLIVENVRNGLVSIPPPLLTRCFQEHANGMHHFSKAQEIPLVPLPFPYVQTCDLLLFVHWCMMPFVGAQWANSAAMAALFSGSQVFALWCLNLIAVEVENPYGDDANDLDTAESHVDMVRNLLQLLMPATDRTPTLSPEAILAVPAVYSVSESDSNPRSFRQRKTAAGNQGRQNGGRRISRSRKDMRLAKLGGKVASVGVILLERKSAEKKLPDKKETVVNWDFEASPRRSENKEEAKPEGSSEANASPRGAKRTEANGSQLEPAAPSPRVDLVKLAEIAQVSTNEEASESRAREVALQVLGDRDAKPAVEWKALCESARQGARSWPSEADDVVDVQDKLCNLVETESTCDGRRRPQKFFTLGIPRGTNMDVVCSQRNTSARRE